MGKTLKSMRQKWVHIHVCGYISTSVPTRHWMHIPPSKCIQHNRLGGMKKRVEDPSKGQGITKKWLMKSHAKQQWKTLRTNPCKIKNKIHQDG